MTTSTRTTLLRWQAEVVDQLLAGDVSVAAFVPDSRLNGVLTGLSERGVPLRSLTREEECVAYAAGQRIAGKRPVVLLQSSGLGNALNALGTLAVPYRLGIPLIISMRGTLGETNPSQIPIGRATAPMLGSLGIQTFSLRSSDDAASMTESVLNMAYQAGETSGLLLEPELGGQRERR
ncbi:thiamine pyrophosphate-binding protein [Saccharopolyspora spinosa]|uniref:Sulfopyruvate decarboxylase alpha subunit n=1 Tax=Saccharopolyspora spinosa TaxID=60894 RepID=A0A2N3Y0Z9_SACSN|nr:thiamine pyrophosphate-binding protein [Saccharopolyspora spinosa]PKW16589.1 sulfopyruvate decarboxylase alpha subunit [Saccharopolyspora spinosa]